MNKSLGSNVGDNGIKTVECVYVKVPRENDIYR